MSDEPSVEIDWLSTDASDRDWRVVWEIRNAGRTSLRIDSAYAPHARFRGAERAVGIDLPAGARSRVELVVRAQPVDDAAPNPFLALRVTRADGPWLVLARLAIVDRGGRPEARATRVSVQRQGFSRDTEAEADADAETRSRKAEGNDKR